MTTGRVPTVGGSAPLVAKLSQLLVAFTVEFDSEFERRMRQEGHPGFVSFAGWRNVLRYIGRDGLSLRDLTAVIPMLPKDTRFTLGCLERWGFVHVGPPDGKPAPMKPGLGVREGFGSSRGFSTSSHITPTSRTLIALEIWPVLLRDIEARWQMRFGATSVENLRSALIALVERFATTPPEGLAATRASRRWATGPLLGPDDDWTATTREDDEPAAIPVLLSQALWTFALMFDREAPMPIAISANLLRVLDGQGVPVADLPALTGNRAVGPSQLLLRSGLFDVVARKGRRGKLLRLTPSGLAAKQAYEQCVTTVERRWAELYGSGTLQRVRAAVDAVRDHDALGEGLRPPPGVPRSGTYRAGFEVGPPGVMKKRTEEMVLQTAAFLANPQGTLPHYPMWDGNRGFGP